MEPEEIKQGVLLHIRMEIEQLRQDLQTWKEIADVTKELREDCHQLKKELDEWCKQ